MSESSYTSRTSVSTSVTQLAQEQRWEQKVTEVRMWSLGTPQWWTVALFVFDSFQLQSLWLNILKIKKNKYCLSLSAVLPSVPKRQQEVAPIQHCLFG